MLGWGGSTSKAADIVECHFCQQRCRLQSHKGKAAHRDHVPVVTGSLWHFQCPACESWNIRDQKTGDLVDHVPVVHEASSVAQSATYHRHPAAVTRASPFCSNCATNQSLQIQLLAGYLPAQATPEEEGYLMSRLPIYQQSLDDRYPLMCQYCQGRIEDIIKERNWKAKARTVGGWLRSSAKLAAVANAPMEDDWRTVNSKIWLWRLKGFCWRSLYLGTILGLLVKPNEQILNGVCARINPTLAKVAIRSTAHPVPTLLSIFTIFFSFWDPTFGERIKRSRPVELKGAARWITLQGLLYLSRIALTLRFAEDVAHLPWICYIVAVLHGLAYLARDRITYIRGPKRMRLVERHAQPAIGHDSRPKGPSSPKQGRTPTRRDQTFDVQPQRASRGPQFGQVSMGSTPPVSRMYKRHTFDFDDEQDDGMDEDDEADMLSDAKAADMDWQPIGLEHSTHDSYHTGVNGTEPAGNAGTNSGITLRPAVFNPENEWNLAAYGMKGLDGLFAKGVSLEDVRMTEDIPNEGFTGRKYGLKMARLAVAFATAVFIAVLLSGSGLRFTIPWSTIQR